MQLPSCCAWSSGADHKYPVVRYRSSRVAVVRCAGVRSPGNPQTATCSRGGGSGRAARADGGLACFYESSAAAYSVVGYQGIDLQVCASCVFGGEGVGAEAVFGDGGDSVDVTSLVLG